MQPRHFNDLWITSCMDITLHNYIEFGIIINPAKCEFSVEQLQFLCHYVDKDGIRPVEEKVRVIQADISTQTPWVFRVLSPFDSTGCPNPEVTQWLDLFHHLSYSMDITSLGSIPAHQTLADISLLFHPKLDAPLNIMTDASDVAVGTVLQRFVDHSSWPLIMNCSPSISQSSISDIWLKDKNSMWLQIIKIWYIQFSQTSTDTCHTKSDTSILYISQFTTNICHINDHDNSVADALSRIDIQAVQQLPPMISFSSNGKSTAREQKTSPPVGYFNIVKMCGHAPSR